MWEHFIEWYGFNNLYHKGQITGFQFKIHKPEYRGVFLSCLSDNFLVKVDEETFPLDKVSLKVRERVIPWSQVDAAYDVFSYFGEVITVMVDKPGGLTPGLHTVECGITIRVSYYSLIDPYGLLNEDPGYKGRVPLPKSYDDFVYKPSTRLSTCSEKMTLVM